MNIWDGTKDAKKETENTLKLGKLVPKRVFLKATWDKVSLLINTSMMLELNQLVSNKEINVLFEITSPNCDHSAYAVLQGVS